MTKRGCASRSFPVRLRGAGLVATMLVVGALGIAGCGGGGGQSASSTSARPSISSTTSATSAKAAVTSAWTTFFDGNTSAQQKIEHLQNGQQFAQVISVQAGSALAKSAGASVTNVDVNGSRATVTYSVTLAGKPVLTDQKGQAVLENGVWKVSDASFCQLLALENGGATTGLPPACPAPSGTPSGAASSMSS